MAILQNGPLPPVDYSERPGSPEESYVGQEGKVTRTFDVAWDERWLFMQSALGFSYVATANGGKFVTRFPPWAYPGVQDVDFASVDNWLYATSVERVEGLGYPSDLVRGQNPKDAQDVYRYEIARVTLGFTSLSYRVFTDEQMANLVLNEGDGTFSQAALDSYGNPDEASLLRYVSRHVQPNSEYLRLPGGQMLWATNDSGGMLQAPSGAVGQGKILATLEIQYTWHQVPLFPRHIFDYIGCVNNDGTLGAPAALLDLSSGSLVFQDNAPGLVGTGNFAPGTLLLTGIELKPYRQIVGTYAFDITYRMKYFSAINPQTGQKYSPERGHNYFLRWQGGTNYGYELLTATGRPDGRPVYDKKNFANLFRLTEQ
jgi:hypothetical protein